MPKAPNNSAKPAPLTLDEAILFGFFVQQYSAASKHMSVDNEGYFPLSAQGLEQLLLDDLAQQKAFLALLNRGYVTSKHQVSAKRKLYKIYVDALLSDIKTASEM